MAHLSIGDVAERAGIAASAVRYYERERLLPRAPRRSGRRVFDESVLDRLLLIEMAKAAGFTIAEIRALMQGVDRGSPPGAQWQKIATKKVDELDERIDQLRQMRRILDQVLACECPSLENCVSTIRGGPDSSGARSRGARQATQVPKRSNRRNG